MKKYIVINFGDDSKKEVGHYLIQLSCNFERLSDYAEHSKQLIAHARNTSVENIQILDYVFYGDMLQFLKEE